MPSQTNVLFVLFKQNAIGSEKIWFARGEAHRLKWKFNQKNAQIFKQAQTLRKENKIAQTFTEDGLVKIRLKKGKNEATHIVRNSIELETIVELNADTSLTKDATSNTTTQQTAGAMSNTTQPHGTETNANSNNTNKDEAMDTHEQFNATLTAGWFIMGYTTFTARHTTRHSRNNIWYFNSISHIAIQI